MQIFVFSFLGAPNVFAQFVEFESFVPYKTTKNRVPPTKVPFNDEKSMRYDIQRKS